MSFSTTAVRSVAVPGLLLLLALAAALSLTIGAKSLPIGTVFTAFSGTCQSADCTIVLDARLPRTLAGLLAGVALGLAGALMQTLTRNPLADPGLLGVNSGASFAIVLGAALFGITSPQEQLLLAFCGALCASLLVAFTGSQGGGQLSPVRLTRRGRPCGGTRGAVQRHRPAQPGRLRSATLLAGRFAGYPHPANAENCPAAGSGGGDRRSAAEPGAEQPEPGQRYRHRPRQPRRPHPADRPDRHHRPVRQRHRRRRPHRLYRPDDAAYGALAGGGRSSLVAAGHPARHPGPAAVCRRDWPPAGARRTAGIGGVRLSRRAGADLAGAPPAAGGGL